MFANLANFLNLMQQKFLTSPAGQYWLQLAPREQKLLGVMTVFLVLFLLYSLLWEPIQAEHKQAQQRLELAQNQWQWLNEQIPAWEASSFAQTHQAQPKTQSSLTDNNQLMAFINQQLAVYKIQKQLKEIKSASKGIKISLKSVDATKLFKWLQRLESQGINFDRLTFERTATAKVDADLVLSLKS